MRCEYCGRHDALLKKPCLGCGRVAEEQEWTRAEPFEYKGYIVWPLRHYLMDMIEFCFYRGRYLEGKHLVSRERIQSHPGYHEGIDIFPQIFDEWRTIIASI